jgi:hypothetical protein
MEQDRDIERGHPGKQRCESRIIERDAPAVGIDLDASKSELPDRAFELANRRVDVVHRYAGGGREEPVGIAAHQLRHLVVRDPREVERGGGVADVLDRRVRRRENLHVSVAGGVHRAEPRVKVEQRGHDALLILEPHLRRRDLLARLIEPRRDDVIEDVDCHDRVGVSRLEDPSVSRCI